MKCKHNKQHKAVVGVHCIEDTGRFVAEVKIECGDCGRPFQFLGLPLGLDLNGTAMSVDGQEARLGIAPVGEVPQPLDAGLVAGFRLQRVGREGDGEWIQYAYAKLGVVRDRMKPEEVEIVQEFLGPLATPKGE